MSSPCTLTGGAFRDADGDGLALPRPVIPVSQEEQAAIAQAHAGIDAYAKTVIDRHTANTLDCSTFD